MTGIEREVSKLQRLPVPKLREKYAEAFGESTRTANKAWLVKRIAWRLQASAEEDLSERDAAADELATQAPSESGLVQVASAINQLFGRPRSGGDAASDLATAGFEVAADRFTGESPPTAGTMDSLASERAYFDRRDAVANAAVPPFNAMVAWLHLLATEHGVPPGVL